MGTNIIFDTSYNIKEFEVDNSWVKDLLDDNYIEYRRRWDLASRNHDLFDFPLFLEVESSYACNYRCPLCPRESLQHTRKGGFLSTKLFDKLFDEIKQYRMPSIAFSHGGEPLMRKDIPELIRKAKDSFVLDRLFHTNGSLLTKELSFELIESGLTKINFSLDAASPAVYNKMRVGGDYKKVINNINEFLQAKKKIGKSYPRIRVSFVVSDENKHEQKSFFNLWKDKVNVIAFQQHYDFSKMYQCNNDKLDNRKVDRYYCSQLWQLLTVTCDGDILICEHDYGHEHILGNLETHTIYECWHSDTMNNFRELHKNNHWNKILICRRCVNCVDREIRLEV